MQSIIATRTANPAGAIPAPMPRPDVLSGPRAEGLRQRLVKLALVFSDVVLALVLWEVACLAQILLAPGHLSGASVAAIVPVALVWVVLRAAKGLYPGYGLDEAEELRRQTHALVAAVAFAATFALAFGLGSGVSRLLLAVVFAGLLFLAPFMRHCTKKWMGRHGVWGKPVVVLGEGDAGLRVEESLSREWTLGFRPSVLLEVRQENRLAGVIRGDEGGLDAAGVLEDAISFGRKHQADTLFLAMPQAPRRYLAELADLAKVHFRSVVVVPDPAGVPTPAVTLGVEVRHDLLDPWVRRAKRALDLTVATIGGLAILPLFLALCLLVWLDSRGPVFHSAKRMGRDEKLFPCLKFRTMVPDAEDVLKVILEEDPRLKEEYSKYHKLREDPRVTRIGRFLRKTSLDELPQLWNVLRGEMSLVGPRPYLPRESSDIGAQQGDILRVCPGITGPWQVGGRNKTSFTDRVHIDGHYARSWSLWLDLVILARTVGCMMPGGGAY